MMFTVCELENGHRQFVSFPIKRDDFTSLCEITRGYSNFVVVFTHNLFYFLIPILANSERLHLGLHDAKEEEDSGSWWTRVVRLCLQP